MNDPLATLIAAVRRDDAAAVMTAVGERPDLCRATGEHAKTALHWAAEVDAVHAARVLLHAGADIEARTSWGATPFDWAATMGSGRVAELLLEAGASGLTIITAAALGRLADVRRFLESGVNPAAHRSRAAPVAADPPAWPADTAHVRGDTVSDALHAAARNGHVAVVEYLLGHGGALDAKGFFGATGLHWAALHGHAPMVEFLVARGASRTVRDAKFGGTPAEWAAEGGHADLAARLLTA